ncbi:MAG: hypothetical protein DBP01_02035 [gamma proteobacterium symbiont of Ctena orbiculata]|nr:MAG: hypothetical protein DBP01_02035 [gamma proteobacterium symbiont of Ctena orbiculata]
MQLATIKGMKAPSSLWTFGISASRVKSVRFAVVDALGMAGGFLFALFSLGAVRELLGEGALFGFKLFSENFEPWVIMILPPGGFITLGLLLLFFNWLKERKDRLAQHLDQMEIEAP